MINYSVCSALDVVVIEMFLYSRPQNMPMMSNDHEAKGMERESRMAIVGSGHGKPIPIAIDGKDNSKPEDVPDDDDDNDDGVEPYKKELVMYMVLKAYCDGRLCTLKWDLANSSSSNWKMFTYQSTQDVRL